MVEAIKNKRNLIRNIVNIHKKILNYAIIYILVIHFLPKVNENRIIQLGLYSINAKFKKSSFSNQRILDCGSGLYNDLFTIPEKIRINNEIKENYNNTNSYKLTQEINIIEYFWEDVSITSCQQMFSECENIIEIDFSNFNTSNVTDTRSMFYGCKNLVSLNLSNFDTSKDKHMSFMFSECHSLISLDLSSFQTSSVFSMDSMFYNSYSLISLDLSNFDTSMAFNSIVGGS